MEQALTVLLVEDDQDECNMFMRLIDTLEDIDLIGVTNNESEALEYAIDHMPDAVIMDLELQKGYGNGIGFLEALSEMPSILLPYILVTTHNESRVTHERARQLGADFIMLKSQKNYNAGNVINLIQSLRKNILTQRKKFQEKTFVTTVSPYVLKKRQKVKIAIEISRVGISPKVIGRDYLIEAILYRIEKENDEITKVARANKKTAASVERAMQNAINKAWSSTPPDDLAVYYTSPIHSDRGVPTVMEFISHYASKVTADYY